MPLSSYCPGNQLEDGRVTPRGDIHARAESAVPGWLYGIREPGHSYGIRGLWFDLPSTDPLHLRFGLGLLQGWLIVGPGITSQRRTVVGALHHMGNAGRATATGRIGTVALCEFVSRGASMFVMAYSELGESLALEEG